MTVCGLQGFTYPSPTSQYTTNLQQMSSFRRRRPSHDTQREEDIRTFKHPDGFSRWPTIAVDPKNKEHKVIKDEISGQLCRERRSSKRPKHSKKQQDSYEVTQGGGLPSIPERIHVSLPPSSRTRREGSISDVSALPTTEDHPRPVSTENSTPRQPSSNRSHWVAVIVEEAKTEERMGGELEEEGGEADIIEEGKEGEAERGPNRPAGEAEVTVVAVAGES
jgi:hypothetical protein